MNLVPVREFHHTSVRENIEENFSILRIYDKRDNTIIVESEPTLNTNNIELEHDGLLYVALTNNIILITFESLINKFKKDE